MATKKRESKLSRLIQKNCNQIHFTRIESNTINGIPDLNGCWAGYDFWLELKSDSASYPKLSKWQISWINKRVAHGGVVIICKETLSESSLKLYRPLSEFTDPRTLKPRFSFSAPVHWPSVQAGIWDLLEIRDGKSRSRAERKMQRFVKEVSTAPSLCELDLARE